MKGTKSKERKKNKEKERVRRRKFNVWPKRYAIFVGYIIIFLTRGDVCLDHVAENGDFFRFFGCAGEQTSHGAWLLRLHMGVGHPNCLPVKIIPAFRCKHCGWGRVGEGEWIRKSCGTASWLGSCCSLMYMLIRSMHALLVYEYILPVWIVGSFFTAFASETRRETSTRIQLPTKLKWYIPDDKYDQLYIQAIYVLKYIFICVFSELFINTRSI